MFKSVPSVGSRYDSSGSNAGSGAGSGSNSDTGSSDKQQPPQTAATSSFGEEIIQSPTQTQTSTHDTEEKLVEDGEKPEIQEEVEEVAEVAEEGEAAGTIPLALTPSVLADKFEEFEAV